MDKFWNLAIDKICEECLRKIFRQKDHNDIVHRDLLDESNDIIINIVD